MSKILSAIGLMSGTSMDAIDVALLETDGESQLRPVHNQSYPINQNLRQLLVRAMKDAAVLTHERERQLRPGAMAQAEREITNAHSAALKQFLAAFDLTPGDIDIIGFHGQTVLHRPEQRLTVQLGDGHALARACGIDVVYDLRAADCAAGGHGAPLVPVYHGALARKLINDPGDRPATLAAREGGGAAVFVNIGGVANVTYVAANGELMAFDTGPGNGLIDDWVMAHTGAPIDLGGAIAARGTVNAAALKTLLSDQFFLEMPPKSLDRNQFDTSPVAQLSLGDGAATLSAFTAHTIAGAVKFMRNEPDLWIICGGGRYNSTLMRLLSDQLAGAVIPSDSAGFDGDAIEAQAFAYLAVRSLNAAPLTFPTTTGVAAPLTGGVLVHAPQP